MTFTAKNDHINDSILITNQSEFLRIYTHKHKHTHTQTHCHTHTPLTHRGWRGYMYIYITWHTHTKQKYISDCVCCTTTTVPTQGFCFFHTSSIVHTFRDTPGIVYRRGRSILLPPGFRIPWSQVSNSGIFGWSVEFFFSVTVDRGDPRSNISVTTCVGVRIRVYGIYGFFYKR